MQKHIRVEAQTQIFKSTRANVPARHTCLEKTRLSTNRQGFCLELTTVFLLCELAESPKRLYCNCQCAADWLERNYHKSLSLVPHTISSYYGQDSQE